MRKFELLTPIRIDLMICSSGFRAIHEPEFPVSVSIILLYPFPPSFFQSLLPSPNSSSLDAASSVSSQQQQQRSREASDSHLQQQPSQQLDQDGLQQAMPAATATGQQQQWTGEAKFEQQVRNICCTGISY